MPVPAAPRAAEHLAARLALELGAPVRLVLTRNRTRLASVSRGPDGTWVVRVHEALAALEDDEVRVLAGFARGRRGARQSLRGLLRRRAAQVAAAARPPRATRLVTAGRVHDLRDVLAEVRKLSFPDLPDVAITWSGAPGRATRRIRLGSWVEERRLVRVHRRLDEEDVPRFFVASVVHHELCHAALGTPEMPGGRRRVHGPDFRRLEARFPDHQRAAAWEAAHLRRLLSPAVPRRTT